MCFDESPLMCWAPPAQGDRAAGPYQRSSEDADNGTSNGLSGADKRRLKKGRRHHGVWWCDSARRPSELSSAAATQLASGSLQSGFYVWLLWGKARKARMSPQVPKCYCAALIKLVVVVTFWLHICTYFLFSELAFSFTEQLFCLTFRHWSVNGGPLTVQRRDQTDWLWWALEAKEAGDTKEEEKGQLEASNWDSATKSTDWSGTQRQNGELFEKIGAEWNAFNARG